MCLDINGIQRHIILSCAVLCILIDRTNPTCIVIESYRFITEGNSHGYYSVHTCPCSYICVYTCTCQSHTYCVHFNRYKIIIVACNEHFAESFLDSTQVHRLNNQQTVATLQATLSQSGDL